MSEKPQFSPNDTYVLDESAIQKTEDMGMTSILRDLDEEDTGDIENSGRLERLPDGYTIELSLDDD